MAVKTLFRSGAFGPGSDLWITPDLSSSQWTKNLDWYLNLQILRSKTHKKAELSDKLTKILKNNELGAPKTFDVDGKPLLIVSDKTFLNKEIVVLPKCADQHEWTTKAFAVWEALGRPTLRLFFPEDIQESSFRKLWPEKINQNIDITLVPDQAALKG